MPPISAPDGSTVRLDCRREGTDFVFTVSDLGPGIDQERLGRIFDRFETEGKGGRKTGAGLGLSIVESFRQPAWRFDFGGFGSGAGARRLPARIPRTRRGPCQIGRGIDRPCRAGAFLVTRPPRGSWGRISPWSFAVGDCLALSGDLVCWQIDAGAGADPRHGDDDGLEVPSRPSRWVQAYKRESRSARSISIASAMPPNSMNSALTRHSRRVPH